MKFGVKGGIRGNLIAQPDFFACNPFSQPINANIIIGAGVGNVDGVPDALHRRIRGAYMRWLNSRPLLV